MRSFISLMTGKHMHISCQCACTVVLVMSLHRVLCLSIGPQLLNIADITPVSLNVSFFVRDCLLDKGYAIPR